MNPIQLSRFPKLSTVISTNFKELFTFLYYEHRTDKKVDATLNIYSVFIDISKNLDSENYSYTGLDILNDKKKLQEQYIQVLGFLYEEFKDTLSIISLYGYARNLIAIFEGIAYKRDFEIISLQPGYSYISNDMKNCILSYKKMGINNKKLEHYHGWICYSKNNKPKAAHLSAIFDRYGDSFGKNMYESLSKFSTTQTSETLEGVIRRITRLFDEFTYHAKTESELYNSMKSENSVEFMLDVMNSMINKSLINNHDPRTIFAEWERGIKDFTECFIETGFFDEPIVPFVTPKFRENEGKSFGITIGGKLSEPSNKRYFDWIPLEIKDEEAIKSIKHRIESDISYVRSVSESIVKDSIYKYERNKRILNDRTINEKIDHKTINAIKMFYNLGHRYKNSRYHNYLGFEGKLTNLLEEINLPSIDTMFAIMYLLVIEHPLITPSWLFNWEMYDKNGNQIGFRSTGTSWVIISSKPRKGADYAQQEVILNEGSKNLVEFLLKYTEYSRKYLRSKNNTNWRYTILKSNLVTVERINKLTSTARERHKPFYNKLIDSKNIAKFSNTLSEDYIKRLSYDISLRNVRKSIGIKTYLETRSFHNVISALGHKKNTTSSLDSYLPEPLVHYFNDRWVRIFQNAILFEAIKDSDNLIDSLDFDEKSLETFLTNHRLSEFPKFMELARKSPIDQVSQDKVESIDTVKFIISVPLLQVLIALKSTIEKIGEYKVSPAIEKWYEAATFILSHFELNKNIRNPSIKKLIPLYNIAKQNPLDEINFKRSILIS